MNKPLSKNCAEYWLSKWVICLTLLLLTYWSLFALLAPVTVWDSQTYNLARLPLTQMGGLFHNPYWNTERQISFPWSFDAIHLPFLWFDIGCSLPSLACFLGTAWMVFRMIARHSNSSFAWLSLLAMLSMPMLVYQSVSSKNDIPLAFLLTSVVYALWNYQSDKNKYWVVIAAICIGFMPGIKSSGLGFSFLSGLYAIWKLRQEPPALLFSFLTSTVLFFILLGSVEIYIHNYLAYHSLIGSESFAYFHMNKDGIAGAIANALRYTCDFFSLPNSPAISTKHTAIITEYNHFLREWCNQILSFPHWNNLGYALHFDISNFLAPKWMQETETNFGTTGALFFICASMQFFTFRLKQPVWQLSLAGWLAFGMICFTVGWMPWNNRFLMPAMLAFCMASMLGYHVTVQNSVFLRFLLIVLLSFGSINTIRLSCDKTPLNLIRSITNRRQERFKERPEFKDVYLAVKQFHNENPNVPWVLCAGGDSWTLPFLTIHNLPISADPQLNKHFLKKPQPPEVFLLFLNMPWKPVSKATLLYHSINEKDVSIYYYSDPQAEKPPKPQ
jgi:hypothetical protein